jgi:hypothetical protein
MLCLHVYESTCRRSRFARAVMQRFVHWGPVAAVDGPLLL